MSCLFKYSTAENSSWKTELLGNIAETTSGGTPDKKHPEYYDNGNILWVRSGELDKGIINDTEIKITNKGLHNSSAKVFPAGTLLIALYGATIGKLAFLGKPAATNQAICAIFHNDKVSLNYLYYYLLFHRSDLVKQGIGGAQPNISQAILKKLRVRYPVSIVEQERIVARIQELFSQLDAGVETLKKAKAQLAVYRQAVLKEAFAGLTVKRPIREMSSLVTSGSRGWAQYYADRGARFIRITDLTRDGIQLKNDSIQYVVLPDKAEGKRSRLLGGDVLVSITADLGSVALIPENIDEAYINQHIAMVRFNNPSQGEFMAWYLRSDCGQKDLLKNRRGGGKLGLGLDDIRDTLVPVVSDGVTQQIVAFIDDRLSVCDNIEQTVDAALQQAEAMRQSILKQAFEGRL